MRLEMAIVAPLGPFRYVVVAPYGIGIPSPGDKLPRTIAVHNSRDPSAASSVLNGEVVVHSMSTSWFLLLGELDPEFVAGFDTASRSDLGEAVPRAFRVVHRSLFKSISGSIDVRLNFGESLASTAAPCFFH